MEEPLFECAQRSAGYPFRVKAASSWMHAEAERPLPRLKRKRREESRRGKLESLRHKQLSFPVPDRFLRPLARSRSSVSRACEVFAQRRFRVPYGITGPLADARGSEGAWVVSTAGRAEGTACRAPADRKSGVSSARRCKSTSRLFRSRGVAMSPLARRDRAPFVTVFAKSCIMRPVRLRCRRRRSCTRAWPLAGIR